MVSAGRSLTKNDSSMGRGLVERHYRCIGIGVGPANLSLASLLHGHSDISNIFLDKKDRFDWHDGQQMPNTSLQVSLFKDLVLLSDPTNSFSFLSYLHEQGKIYHFINAQFDTIPRKEFRNYLEWASRRNENIIFGEEIRAVEFDRFFVLHTSKRILTAENIVIGVGNQPWVPPPGQGKLGETQFHVTDFINKAHGLSGKRVAVIGGGQSGAEAFLDLISRHANERPRRVTWISRRGNYFPLDDSPFTNEYYTPSYSDYFFNLESATRKALNAQNLLTSDGISESMLREIYQQCYVHRFVDGTDDLLALLPNRNVTDVIGGEAGGWAITAVNNDRPDVVEHVEVDTIVWATGFRSTATDFLTPIEGLLEREGGEYRVDQDFAVYWDGPRDRNIFVQNAVREQRGLADPNLSLIAWRSQRIVDRLRGTRINDHNDQLASFIEWSAKVPANKPREAGCRR